MSCTHNVHVLIGVGISVFAVVVFLLFCDVKLKPEYGGPPLPHREVQSNRFARSDDKLPEGEGVGGRIC